MIHSRPRWRGAKRSAPSSEFTRRVPKRDSFFSSVQSVPSTLSAILRQLPRVVACNDMLDCLLHCAGATASIGRKLAGVISQRRCNSEHPSREILRCQYRHISPQSVPDTTGGSLCFLCNTLSGPHPYFLESHPACRPLYTRNE